MKGWLKASVILGAVPLAAGVLSFLGWVATRSETFAIAGLGVLTALPWTVLIGISLLAIHAVQASRGGDTARPLLARAGKVLGLHAFTVFAALGLLWVAQAIDSTDDVYRLHISNMSPDTLTDARVVGAGVNLDAGDLPPHTDDDPIPSRDHRGRTAPSGTTRRYRPG